MKSAYKIDWITPAMKDVMIMNSQWKILHYSKTTSGKRRKFGTGLRTECSER